MDDKTKEQILAALNTQGSAGCTLRYEPAPDFIDVDPITDAMWEVAENEGWINRFRILEEDENGNADNS